MESICNTVIKTEDHGASYLSIENVKEMTAKSKIVNHNKEIRVIHWISVQSKITPEEYVDPNDPDEEGIKSLKRKYDSDDDQPTSDRECCDDEPLRKKGRGEPETYLDCEWVGCRYNTVDYALFQDHVKSHLPDVIVKSYNNGSNVYVCLWDLCDFETASDKMIKTHVNYHTYHTKVKALGKIVLHNQTKCLKDSSLRNRLPSLPEEFTCLWRYCTHKFCAVQDFFDHIKSHANGERRGRGDLMSCQWMGCPIKKSDPRAFLRHVLTHSLFRAIACPNCGNTFTNKTTMVVHCERQKKKLDYKCEVCHKLFASQRILRKHAHDHKREFRCEDCNLSFTRKSSLASHIRQVHLNLRPLHCNMCDYKCANKTDMRDHLDRHEKKGRKWVGALEGRQYVCHYCEKVYCRATGLSQHLIKVHGYKTTSRNNKYKYVLTEEGVYRLNDIVQGPVPRNPKHTAVTLKDIDEEMVNKDFKLVKCGKSGPKYTLVKASETEKEVKKIEENEEMEDIEIEKPYTLRSTRASKKKYFKCRKCKKYIVKENNVSSHKCDQDVFDLSIVKEEITIKEEVIVPVEISIEEIDLQGNIVKVELVESSDVLLA